MERIEVSWAAVSWAAVSWAAVSWAAAFWAAAQPSRARICRDSIGRGRPDGGGRCRCAAQGISKITTIEGFTEYRLDNGLQVLICPDISKPTVTVNLTVFVGSRHEGYGETGMAHLLEHMLFKGTPTHTPYSRRPEGARGQVQRHHLGRSDELLRDDAGHRAKTWNSGCRWRPTG